MSSTIEPRECTNCKKLSDFSYLKNSCDWCGTEFKKQNTKLAY